MFRSRESSAVVTITSLAMLASSCATVGGLKNSEGDGETRYYRAEREDLLNASLIALGDRGLAIAEIDEEAAYVLAFADLGASSYGEVVGVFVGRSAQDSTVLEVRVVSRKRLATNVFAKNWEGEVLDGLEVQLPAEAIVLQSSADVSVPSISETELAGCLSTARDAGRVMNYRDRQHEVRDCRAEGGGDSDATLACFERKRTEREELGPEPDMDVLNACLAQARKDEP